MDKEKKKYYKDKQWQSKRVHILERDHYTCVRCEKKCAPSDLHVHHLHYRNDKKAWEYEDFELVTLCKGCHSKEHGILPPDGGWEYCGVDDLGMLFGVCERCGHEIRYEHHIFHPKWGYMVVGSVCADILTNSTEASEREMQCKKVAQKYRRYINSSKWEHRKNGYFFKLNNYQIQIWKNLDCYRLEIKVPLWDGDRQFWVRLRGRRYRTLEDAKKQAFQVITNGELKEYIKEHYSSYSQYPPIGDSDFYY